MCITTSFIPPPRDRLSPYLVNNNAATIMGVQMCSEKLLSFPLDVFPEVRLLERIFDPSFNFEETFYCFSRVTAPIYLPNTVQGSPFSPLTLIISCLLTTSSW